jgi:hypothetical protein
VTLETGKLARLTSGSCVASVGDTHVLATAIWNPVLESPKDNAANFQVGGAWAVGCPARLVCPEPASKLARADCLRRPDACGLAS